MTNKPARTPREQLASDLTPELYHRIRRLWMQHSIAEENRDLPGLLETLAEDCVYEVLPTGQRWVGHDGARAFYEAFLAAFPDVHFDLIDIVIGPQGVMEVAELTGTHQGRWADRAPTGHPVRVLVVIHFPWDPEYEKFAGEKIYFDRAALPGG
jgi:predicted ester cyclase